jgi:hypothetical protein
VSYSEIASRLRQAIQRPLDAAMPPGAEVLWPNAPGATAESQEAGPWAAVDIQWLGVDSLAFGAGLRLRHRGILEAVLVWPAGAGEGGLFAAADQLASALTETTAGPVRIRQPELVDADAGEGWAARAFRLAWTADETKSKPSEIEAPEEGTWALGSAAIRQALSAVVAASTGLTVVYGNAPQESPPVTEASVYARVLTGAQIPNQASESSDATKIGAFLADIVTPAGIGTGLALSIADKISNALSMAKAGRIELGAATLTDQSLVGPSWVTTIQIPYRLTHAH